MRAKIITTIGPNCWDRYAKRFVESFAQRWPQHIELEVWHHHLGKDVPSHPRATFRCLDDTESFKKITSMLGAQAKDGPSLNYSFKAVAMAMAVEPDVDWIGFLDADTETMQNVDDTLLGVLFDPGADLTYLWRKSVRESEGSWFAFNLTTREGASLLSDYWGLYDSGEAFHYKKAHDNAVLDRLVTIHRAHNLRVRNLAEGALGLDAFHQSPLGAYLVHYKGPNKDTIANPGLALPPRYENLCSVVRHSVGVLGKANLVEVGTWNGSRAVQMAEAAFESGATEVSYMGFDTFDDGNDRAHEGHTKPHASMWVVERRLQNYATVMARLGKKFSFMLFRGNTLSTLPAAHEFVKDATFAYIDGGHSHETTKSDYECLKHVPYIVFDDIIVEEEPGAPEGPRQVFKEITNSHKQLWNAGDGYGGLKQTIALGIISNPPHKPYEIRQPLQVKPVDSVEKTEQFKYIAENTKAIGKWIEGYQAHTGRALLVSAGPTLPSFLEEIRKKQAEGATIFCVKHAYPILKNAGITPDFTVVLDPRPVDGISTHGVLRTELFTKLGAGDRFLVATMTHPSVRETLEAGGADIYGWHALTQGVQNAGLPELKTGLVIGGGTCAATRLPVIAFVMGFRRYDFYGYDFYYPTGTKQADVKQQLLEVGVGPDHRRFLTTGELVAAMQDLGTWVKWMVENRLTVNFHGDGAGAIIWQTTAPGYQAPGEYPF